MDQELITIDVEGRSVTAPPDQSIIEAIGPSGFQTAAKNRHRSRVTSAFVALQDLGYSYNGIYR